jgi:hypothetical protein
METTTTTTNFAETYWHRTRRPLPSLLFLLPLLTLYEFGVLWIGGHDPEALRNGADSWKEFLCFTHEFCLNVCNEHPSRFLVYELEKLASHFP